MATNPIAGLGQDQFLQLLLAQLQNQDPLDPVNNQDFIAQLTSLNTLQGIQSLNATFSEVLKLQQLTNGAGLIGKTIEYKDADGNTGSGKVASLEVRDGQFVLAVGSTTVGLDQITGVNG